MSGIERRDWLIREQQIRADRERAVTEALTSRHNAQLSQALAKQKNDLTQSAKAAADQAKAAELLAQATAERAAAREAQPTWMAQLASGALAAADLLGTLGNEELLELVASTVKLAGTHRFPDSTLTSLAAASALMGQHLLHPRSCGAVELQPIEGKPTARATGVFRQCFDNGLLVRTTGDTIALCPPLIASEDQVRTVVQKLKECLNSID